MRLAAIALAGLLASCPVPTQDASETQLNGSAGAPAPGASLPRRSLRGRRASGAAARSGAGRDGDSDARQRPGRAARLQSVHQRALMAADGAPVRTDRVCTLELRTIESGRVATYPYQLPASVMPGTYRFSTTVERMQSGTRTTLTSNEITVR